MKFRSKLFALLLALTLIFSVFGGFSVSATEEESQQYTAEDIQMLADLYQMSFNEVLGELGITEEDLIPSEEVSKSDAVYSYTDLISSLKLSTHTTSVHNISYKLPEGGSVYSLADDDSKLFSYAGASKKDLMNNYNIVEIAEFADELTNAVVYYQITALEDTSYGKYIGNYNKLSVEEQNALVQVKIDEGSDENNTYTVKKNGQVYLVARTDLDQMSENGFCTTEADITTVINGTIYTGYIYIQHGGTATDAAVADEIINGFAVKGAASREVSTQTIAIVALCIVGFLFIVIAFLVFFIIRFSLFSKASGSKFNIIGFNMPRKISEPAVSKNNFRAKTGVKDSLNDDTDSE